MATKKEPKPKMIRLFIWIPKDLKELVKEAVKANPSGMSFSAYVRGCLAKAARRDLRGK